MVTGSELVLDALKFLLGTAVGAAIVNRIGGQAKLVTNWGHISAFTVKGGGTPVTINTHEVVVRNTGNAPATMSE